MIDRRVAVISLALLLPLLLGTVLTVYDAWSDSQRLVVTKDARVVTVTAHARSPVAGQVGEHFVHVGDVVREGDVVALVIGPERLRVQVRAPLTGTVLALVAQEGAAVGAGEPLVTIGDLDGPWVVASLSPGAVARVQVGQRVEVLIRGLSAPLAGTVTEVLEPGEPVAAPPDGGDGSVDESTGAGLTIRLGNGSAGSAGTPAAGPAASVPVRIDLLPGALPPPALFPEMPVEVRIILQEG
ncbi:MAG TPA: HlyD family efflux transporter periplasmic adaptor subunit [Chloroflexota bacterium]|nr:HlyD family efflux transporter periplasmic adaptor subunit [Chloroflexota bacterium]